VTRSKTAGFHAKSELSSVTFARSLKDDGIGWKQEDVQILIGGTCKKSEEILKEG